MILDMIFRISRKYDLLKVTGSMKSLSGVEEGGYALRTVTL